MYASSSSISPLSKKDDRRSRSNTPADEGAHLSDVPCYTCRRRHVKCDRMLPTCAKCAKKGVSCLGYQKPLRWADGVAVRGKLKGKSQPVVDSNVASIVKNTVQVQSTSAIKQAAHFGLHATEALFAVGGNESRLLELMAYHNSRICAEYVTLERSSFPVYRSIAPLSYEIVERLPRDYVNCILGYAVVHMASRQPGNPELERLALETKVSLFQSFNRLLQSRQNQPADVIVCCCALICAMDLIEHGVARWMIHYQGSLQIMGSFGGIENLFTYYPHLQLTLAHMGYLETLWISLSHVALTKTKQTSRTAMAMFCNAPAVKRKFFNPCPVPLTLALWDTGSCASKVLGNRSPITLEELHNRDHILLDVLAFRPEDSTKEIKESYYKDIPITEERLNCWNAIYSAWKGAVTILVLRYLYLGRPELSPQSQLQRSSPPSFHAPTGPYFTSRSRTSSFYDETVYPDELADPYLLPDQLSLGLYLENPISRSPSPMPSLLPSFTEPPTPDLWEKRYGIHDEAFTTLSTNLFFLHDDPDPMFLRHVLLPIFVLALVSRPGSSERALCVSSFAKFKTFMAETYPPDGVGTSPSPVDGQQSPIGGGELEMNIPWESLDSYCAVVEAQTQENLASLEDGLANGAPEFNWWDMLKHMDLNVVWPIEAGTSHLERGQEFYAFTLVSSVVNEDCFSAFTQRSNASEASSSSSIK